MKSSRRGLRTRKPRQRRSRQTVEAILDAVVRILKREGFDSVTTNRIAEVAGVSIGSLYQYFPDKKAIFVALHARHLEHIDRVIQSTLVEHASSRLDTLLGAMVDAMIEAHLDDPELYELLATEVPHGADGAKHFAERLHSVFRLALASRAQELKESRDLDSLSFVVAHMVESLCHGALSRRPPGMSLRDAKTQIVRALMAYLRA